MARTEYGRADWQSEPAAAYQEAERRVAALRADPDPEARRALFLSDLRALRRVPPGLGEIEGLRRIDLGDADDPNGRRHALGRDVRDASALASARGLWELNLAGAGLADLAPLAALTRLIRLDLSDCPAEDLRPLSGLADLQMLVLKRGRVADLRPLSNLHRLAWLDVTGSPVSDLSPLAALPALQALYASDTWIDDLSPLADHPTLVRLSVAKTPLADLAPLGAPPDLDWLDLHSTFVRRLDPLLGLPRFAALRAAGLDFRSTPAAEGRDLPPSAAAILAELAALGARDPRACAVETVRHLQGLPPQTSTRDDPAIPQRAGAVAEAADVDVIRRDDDLLAIDRPGAARADPGALADRLAGLRAAAEDLLAESREPAVGQVPDLLRTRLVRYTEALSEDPPRYHLMVPPIRRLRAQIAGEARAWLEESGVDAGFLAGLDGLLADHEALAPYFLPPSEAAAARDALMPPLRDDADPVMLARLVAELREDVDRLATLGHADPSLPAAVQAAGEDVALAEESPEARPSALRRAVKVAGVVIVRLIGFGRLARDAGRSWGALKAFFASDEWAVMSRRLASLLDEIEAMLSDESETGRDC